MKVTVKDLKTLRPREWLNDIIIDAYFQLIKKRDPSVHVFSFNFFNNYFTRSYDEVQRWSKDVGIFSKKKLLIPVHSDRATWKCVHVLENIPLQNNSYDCGVFVCQYANYISRDERCTFTAMIVDKSNSQ
ncbi:sentrin-specific protease 2-like [Aphidius gifuensis]|uniref:sentrin-specific protease 2-like n=1 Tax=Aphidius gifuensis TaxID=684658 RepID=UPI001CDC1596|nr:sentrin-specific protease 2-like [Aphidius gifuensis]